MDEPAAVHRSFLYAPGSNERILEKVLDAGADAVILDLEDAVAPPDKLDARRNVAELIATRAGDAACGVHVRINADGRGFSSGDVDAIVQPGLEALRLPKCESGGPIAELDEQLARLEHGRGLELGSIRLYPTIESAAGVIAADTLARSSPRVAALVFGPSDFAGDIGLLEVEFDSTLVARSHLVLHSAAARIGRPIDGAFTDLTDMEGLETVCRKARSLGFAGKSAIHPRQIETIHRVFTPTADEIDHAQRIVDSLDESTATATVDGRFVDPAVVVQARAVLQLAEHANRRKRS